MLTSLSATTRSTSRPWIRYSLSSRRSILRPGRLRPEEDDAFLAFLVLAGLVDSRRHRSDGLRQPVTRDGGDDDSLRVVVEERADVGHDVGLRAEHDPGPFEQLGLVLAELLQEHPLLLVGVDAMLSVDVLAGEVEHQAQDPRPLDVAEELVTEPLALAGALDETGNVGDDELGIVIETDHAEVRLERRERVVGDLRLGRRDHRDQRALARRSGTRRARRRPSAGSRA